MYHYGKRSEKNLATCHPDIQLILREAIKIIDISVIEGHRTLMRQQELFNSVPQRTTLDGIVKKSNHQTDPSMAVDIVPYKKGYNPFVPASARNAARFYFMMGIIKGIAVRLLELGFITHKVRFGLDWNSNDVFSDQKFHDLPHMELVPA